MLSDSQQDITLMEPNILNLFFSEINLNNNMGKENMILGIIYKVEPF